MTKQSFKLVIIICIATLFMSIGYAAINSITMDITGIAEATPPEGIFISDVQYNSNIEANLENSNINNFYQTTLNSTICLSQTNPLSEITYNITIHNNSEDTYVFENVVYEQQAYDNQNITYNLTGLQPNDVLIPNQSITFQITFKYANTTITNNTLNSYINFNFNKQYNITYVDITNNNYPTTAVENGSLQITFTDNAPTNINIEGTCNYTYQNNILSVTNIQSNLIITGVIVTDPNSFIISDLSQEIHVGNIDSTTGTTIADLVTLTFTGNNQTPQTITGIDVMYDYSTSKGSKQSINCTLTHNSTPTEQTITFQGNTSGTVTASFTNLNINQNDSFTISNIENKLTNKGIDITAVRIKVYTT